MQPSSWVPEFKKIYGFTIEQVIQMGKRNNETITSTHSFFLGCGLLLRSRLLLGRGLFLRSRLLGLGCCSGLFLVVSAELVRALDLREIPVRHGLLQCAQEHAIQPLINGRKIALHVLLDGNGGGAGAVL